MSYRSTPTDRQWEKWAKQNPYFGVLLVESEAVSKDEDIRRNFFDSGERHIEEILSVLTERFGEFGREAALDFGCGVGRLLLPLARRFNRVYGIDVSPTMLQLASANMSNASNVDFARTPAELARRGESFDFVHSYIVLQHVRPKQGVPLIKELVSLVRPGGVFALHVTVGDTKRWRRALNSIRYRVKPVHWLYNIARKRRWNESITEMNGYDLGMLIGCVSPQTNGEVWLRHIDQGGHNSVFLCGRRT